MNLVFLPIYSLVLSFIGNQLHPSAVMGSKDGDQPQVKRLCLVILNKSLFFYLFKHIFSLLKRAMTSMLASHSQTARTDPFLRTVSVEPFCKNISSCPSGPCGRHISLEGCLQTAACALSTAPLLLHSADDGQKKRVYSCADFSEIKHTLLIR